MLCILLRKADWECISSKFRVHFCPPLLFRKISVATLIVVVNSQWTFLFYIFFSPPSNSFLDRFANVYLFMSGRELSDLSPIGRAGLQALVTLSLPVLAVFPRQFAVTRDLPGVHLAKKTSWHLPTVSRLRCNRIKHTV